MENVVRKSVFLNFINFQIFIRFFSDIPRKMRDLSEKTRVGRVYYYYLYFKNQFRRGYNTK